MSKYNKVNPGQYKLAGRLTPDEAAGERVKQQMPAVGGTRTSAKPARAARKAAAGRRKASGAAGTPKTTSSPRARGAATRAGSPQRAGRPGAHKGTTKRAAKRRSRRT